MFLMPDHAELMKKHAGKKYRPSNGTEGELFFSHYCDKCSKKDTCQLMHRTMAFDVEHPEYPAEICYSAEGQPTCTEFDEQFQLEQKYVVYKIKDIELGKKRGVFTNEELAAMSSLQDKLGCIRENRGKDAVIDCVVIESSWEPEYKQAVDSIQNRFEQAKRQ